MAKGLSPTLKHGTAEDWAKAVNYVPQLHEIIVYDVLPPKIKIGDGITKVNDLPFACYSEYKVDDNDTLIL